MKTPLYEIREDVGWTQQQVAEALGIDQGHLSRLERGCRKASPELAARIVEVYNGAISEIEVLYPERFSGGKAKRK